MSDAALQIAELSAALAAQTARAQAAEAELAQARALASCTDAMIQELKLEIAKLRRDKYGISSERRARLIDQLELQLEELEATATEDALAAQAAAAADKISTVRAFTRGSTHQITGLVARLLVVTGMRIGELTSLNVGDVSGAASRIRVNGKGNRERTVYVTNERLLMDFRHYWEQRYKCAGTDACLFFNLKGNRLTAPAFRKRLRTVSKSLLVEPHLTPHQFRHSAATLLIEEGVDIRLVQRLLGHASIATTEIYTKVSDNSLVAAIERADTLAQVDS